MGKQQLWLHETSRFSGSYEGYLQLTDANGGEEGWGLDTGAATGETMAKAATLGVESGPVTIRYKDTDGKTRELVVAIDKVPPAIQIDQPAHKSEGQDTSPEFSGSFTDGESGLRDDSFRLYIDHQDDANENGENATYLALDIPVKKDAGPYGTVDVPTTDQIESISDYSGYPYTDTDADKTKHNVGNKETFGVIPHADVFNLAPAGAQDCGDTDKTRLCCWR